MIPGVPELAAVLVTVWCEILGTGEHVDEESDVLELGASSMDYVLFSERAIEMFGAHVPIDALLSASSIREMAEVVAAVATAETEAPDG